MKIVICIICAIAFGFIARWAQKRFSKYEMVMKNSDETEESRADGKFQ